MLQNYSSRQERALAMLQSLAKAAPHRVNPIPVYNASLSASRYSTVAMTLSAAMISEIELSQVELTASGQTCPEFFDAFVKKYVDFFCKRFNIDADLLEVHSRQMMILLKQAELVRPQGGTLNIATKASAFISANNGNLLKVWWSRVNWSDFFPSMPSVASFLQKHKKKLVTLILEREGVYNIDSLGIDFILASDLEFRNELLFFSFLDFSVLTWLSHFGLISYEADKNRERVGILVSEIGRECFESLLNCDN